MTKMATRDAYGKALVKLGQINDNVVVLDADLSKSTKTNDFCKAFPSRFFNMVRYHLQVVLQCLLQVELLK